MDALGAARMGDEIAHGAGILGMLAGAVVGAVVAVAVVAAVAATGGLAIVIFAGAIAGGALAANQILKGLKTIFELPDPTTGVLASGSHNVFTNSMAAARATLDFASSCTGGSFPFITHPYWPYPVAIAEGAKKVTINSMPAARITMLMTCSAFIKTASDNVFIGGPTARTEFVWDWTGWLETGFTWLGLAAMGGAAVLAVMAGVAATATFVAAVGVTFAAFEGLGMLGDAIGPGYRDLFQGIAGMALILGTAAKTISSSKVRLPVDRSNKSIREWYNQETSPKRIANLNRQWKMEGRSLAERAQRTFDVRHNARIKAREMMQDKDQVEILRARDREKYDGRSDGPDFNYEVNKYKQQGMSEQEAHNAIIEGASRTNEAYNAKFGIKK